MSAVGSGRTFSESGMEQERGETKRSKHDRGRLPELGLYRIGMIADDDLASRNVIWMNRSDFETLYLGASSDNYLRIANRIYTVAESEGLTQGIILMNRSQESDVRAAIFNGAEGPMVLAAPVRDITNFPCFTSVHIRLRRIASNYEEVVWDLGELKENLLSHCKERVISSGQVLSIHFPWGNVEAVIGECSSLCGSIFGFVTKKTELDFICDDNESITLVDHVYDKEVEKYCFSLSLEKKRLFIDNSVFPLRVSVAELKKQIQDKLSRHLFIPGHKIRIPHAAGWDIVVKFERGVLEKNQLDWEADDIMTDVRYQHGFRLKEDPTFSFSKQGHKLLLTNEQEGYPQSVQVKALQVMESLPGSSIDIRNERWIDRTEVIDLLKARGKSFFAGERFEVNLQSGKFLFEIAKIVNETGTHVFSNQDSIIPAWKLGKDTQVEITCDKMLNVNILRDKQPETLQRVAVKVDIDTGIGEEEIALENGEVRAVFDSCRPEKLVMKQRFSGATADGHRLTFSVTDWKFRNASATLKKRSAFGKVAQNTEVVFVSKKFNDLTIVDRIYENEIDTMEFHLDLSKNRSHVRWNNRPLVMNIHSISEKIKEKIGKKKFILEGHQCKIKNFFHSGYDITVTFKKAKFKQWNYTQDNQVLRHKHKVGYRISEGVNMRYQATEDILLIKGMPTMASSLSFKIESQIENYIPNRSKELRGGWISLEEFKKELLSFRESFVENESFTITLSSGKFAIKVVRGRDEEEDVRKKKALTNYWIADMNTRFVLPSDSNRSIHVVRNTVAEPLKKVVVEVAPVPPKPSNPLAALLGDEPEMEPVKLKKEELDQLFAEYRPRKLLPGQSVILKTDHHQKIEMVISELKFQKEVFSHKNARVLGEVNDRTEVVFVAKSKTPLSIEEPIALLGVEDPVRYIQDLGLGGIEEQIEQLQRIFYLRSPALRKEAEKLGLKPVSGVLFYGPPGTGKTTLARHLGKLLGCSGDRFQKVTSTEILSKYVGENEQNLRNLFQPAIDARKEYGDESPLFILVLDEIDAILGKRGTSIEKWGDRLVNQFLGIQDGLEELDNLLVIGLTNRKDKIDPAVLRPGRLELHIELAIPKSDGRRKIFEIHLKKLSGNNKLDRSVDLDLLVEKTDGFSGADIEGLVKKAAEFPLQRLSKLGGKAEDIDDLPDGKISMDDFLKALDEVKGSRDQEVLPPMYT